jgi:glutamate mutase epsilon subunit
MMEASGDQVEGLIDTPQAIEHHRVDGFPYGEVSHVRVLVRRLVNDVANAKFVEHASHKAEVIQHLAMVSGRVGHNSLL